MCNTHVCCLFRCCVDVTGFVRLTEWCVCTTATICSIRFIQNFNSRLLAASVMHHTRTHRQGLHTLAHTGTHTNTQHSQDTSLGRTNAHTETRAECPVNKNACRLSRDSAVLDGSDCIVRCIRNAALRTRREHQSHGLEMVWWWWWSCKRWGGALCSRSAHQQLACTHALVALRRTLGHVQPPRRIPEN